MNKILIIEDNKTLAKLIAKKISSELNFEVDVAFKLSEAKLFLKRYKYFLVLVDLNLPDAPNGESIDYVLDKGARAIVLTGNIDKDFREKILKKNIIDYINKTGVNDINHIIETIKRLQKNQETKILVVDDSMIFRKYMKELLENLFFKVITVAHGEEAMGMLSLNPDTSLILTDYNMPVMNGIELTKKIREKYTKNDIGIIALSSNKNEDINAMFLKEGANDFIKKPFSKEEFSCRVNNTIEAQENIRLLTRQIDRDTITGLYNRNYLTKNTKNIIDTSDKLAIAIIGIDNFKDLSESLDKKDVEKILITLSNILRSGTDYRDTVIRVEEDEFYIIFKETNLYDAVQTISDIILEAQNATLVSAKEEIIKFTISAGLAVDDEDDFLETVNQADMMLYNAKQKGGNQVCFE